MSRVYRDLALLAGFVLAVQLPFVGQAFVVDDGAFVDQALQIVDEPGAPYSFVIRLTEPRDFFAYMANPPGQAYFLAAAIAAFGRSEVFLQLATTLLVALAAFAMYALAREIVGHGLFAAALLVATPAFALSGHTVMAEPGAAALTLVAMLLFVQGVDRGDTTKLLFAGLTAGFAMLFKYSALSLFPLMILYLLLRRALRPQTFAALAIAALVFGGWCAASAAIYGEIHPLRMVHFESGSRSAGDALLQILSVVLGLGAATVFPPVLLCACIAASFRLSRIGGWTSGVAALGAFAAALPAYPLDALAYDLANRVLGGLLLASGTAALAFVFQCGWTALGRVIEERPVPVAAARTILLVGWFAAFLFFDARLAFASPKYLVPGIAPLLLLLLGSLPEPLRAARWQHAAALSTTLALSLVLSTINAIQANAHKYVALERVPELARGRTGWFNGHWTVRYYAERAGHRYLPAAFAPEDPRPRSGDVVFVVLDAARHAVPPDLARRLEEVDRWTAPAPVPLRLAGWTARAGYWAHLQGVMPFVWSSEPVSTTVTYRVE